MSEHPLTVFVPGLGLNDATWEAVRAELAGPATVVLLPSLGRPAPRRTDLRVQAQATRLLERLPRGRPVILVGHSAGCPVIVEAASRSNDVVGLVLVGPVTDPTAQSWPRMLAQWGRVATDEHPWEIPIVAPQYLRTGLLSMVRGMNAMRRFRTDHALAALDLPVEIIRGAQDAIAAQRWSSELEQACHGHLTIVDEAAHMVPLPHPKVIVAAVGRIRAITRKPSHCATP